MEDVDFDDVSVPELPKSVPFSRDDVKEICVRFGATGIGKGVHEVMAAYVIECCRNGRYPKIATQWQATNFALNREWLLQLFPSARDRKLIRPRLFRLILTVLQTATRIATKCAKRKNLQMVDVKTALDCVNCVCE